MFLPFLFPPLRLPFIDYYLDVTSLPVKGQARSGDRCFIIIYTDSKKEKETAFSFFWRSGVVAHVTVLGRVGRCAVRERNNGGKTCYTVNNKNIKRAGNPKGREVTSKRRVLQKKPR